MDENTGLVVDIDVSDQDSEAHHYDLCIILTRKSATFHTGDYSSLSNSYTTGSWTDVDDSLSPSLILHGDLIMMVKKILYYSRSRIMNPSP